MVRGRVWFRCAAMHDPVSPIIVTPSILGWDAKFRDVDLVIERSFSGEELVRRMKGWITINPNEFIRICHKYGRLKVLDDRILVIEVEEKEHMDKLKQELATAFSDQVDIEIM